MNPEIKTNEQRENETNEIYSAIGEFIVEFEHICFAIQTSSIFILQKLGLKNQDVARLFVNKLTAGQLKDKFKDLVFLSKIFDTEELEMIKNILDRFQNLIERRNEIIHSTWFIGYPNSETNDYTTADNIKLYKEKDGFVAKAFTNKVSDFRKLTQEARTLSPIFSVISLPCIVEVESFSIKNLLIVKDGLISLKEGIRFERPYTDNP
ncbi:hypothetical protein [Nostoc sp.]|uniref:hypothetical protein n=1 Tax=Nostoc sp. TaxID=1180 RepID=UPI002FF5D385